MIVFIFGTTAEAIKLAPIARRLTAAGVPYESWVTYQHTDSLKRLLPQLGFRPPTQVIANGRAGEPLRTRVDVIFWLFSIIRWTLLRSRKLRKKLPRESLVVVHGDTMTSVVGALVAKFNRLPSAHVEAGLRSGNWRHPFPEELDRRIVGRLASIHYAPSETAVSNLRRKGNVVFTHGNTVIDAVLDHAGRAEDEPDPFGLVLLHRFEFISNQQLVEQTVRTLAKYSRLPLRVVVDAYSKRTMESVIGNAGAENIHTMPKLDHEGFVSLLRNAQFVITDSGGIQEETALLGTPTMVHRVATERAEGLDRNVRLSHWNQSELAEFLTDYETLRHPIQRPEQSPSDIVVRDILARGIAPTGAEKSSNG